MQVSTIVIKLLNKFLFRIFNNCSHKAPTVLTCLQNAQTRDANENDFFAFFKAHMTLYQNELCVGDISDEQFEKLHEHIVRLIDIAESIDKHILLNHDV